MGERRELTGNGADRSEAADGASEGPRRSRGRGWVRSALLAATVCASTLFGALVFADRLIFFPPTPSYGQELGGLVRLPTARGDTVAARYVDVPGARATLLFAHGNAEDIGQAVPFHDRLAALGLSVLAVDYPGYGLSPGRPTEAGSYAAIDAAYAWLVERGTSPESIVVHGRSLGGGMATELASKEEVGGLILESTFVSAYRVMTRARLLPFDQFDNLSKLPDVAAPVLVIHGGRDAVVAPWHGRHLYDALPEEQRTLLWVERAGHNDLAYVAGDDYWNAIDAFVSQVVGIR